MNLDTCDYLLIATLAVWSGVLWAWERYDDKKQAKTGDHEA